MLIKHKVPASGEFRQFLSYFCVGGISAIVEWIFFTLLLYLFDLPYAIATALAFIFSTATNWVLGRRFTFRESAYKEKMAKEIILVYLVSAVGLVFNLLLMRLFVEGFEDGHKPAESSGKSDCNRHRFYVEFSFQKTFDI